MGAGKFDRERKTRGYDSLYAWDHAAGVQALLRDQDRIAAERYNGNYAACDILLDLATALADARLSKRQAETLRLMYGKRQMTQAEAAGAMGITQKNVSVHLAGATAKIARVYLGWGYGAPAKRALDTELSHTQQGGIDDDKKR